MGKLNLSLIVICLFLLDPLCHSQTSVQVSDPRLEIRDNTLHISYDILNSAPSDTFIVNIDISDSDGNTIDAKTLNGDLGNDVNGGNNKHVTWNLEADSIFIDARIFITVYAELVPPPEPLIPPVIEDTIDAIAVEEEDKTEGTTIEKIKKEEVSVENSSKDEILKEDFTKKEPPAVASKSYNRTGIVFQSLAFPGLGLSRMTGNPHWLRGLVGYGCLAGSVVLNRMAIATYEDYRYTEVGTKKDNYYDLSTTQDNVSEILAYTAIGIWVTDFIWTLIGSSDLKKQHLLSEMKGFSISTGVDQQTQVPLIGIRYQF